MSNVEVIDICSNSIWFLFAIHIIIIVDKGSFTQSNCSIKNLIKVFFDKVLWSCKPASKRLWKNFDGLWWELTNQNIFPNKIICKQKHMNLKNGDWEIQSCVVERSKLWPCNRALRNEVRVHKLERRINKLITTWDMFGKGQN